ncbi:MAG: hypothetical protein FJ143_05535 [Deltaproteobacteria bacterium]|nr:hypothetical protein [Deltaproteobacteria bacterium]
MAPTQGASSTSSATFLVANFSDDPINPGVTPIKAIHITELRGYIDVLRGRYGLPAAAWTDSSPGATTPLRAVHIIEMRGALAAVYSAANRTPPVYTDPTLSSGQTAIRAVHIRELRTAVAALY